MTLYLKYRPNNLDQLDLANVSESLKKIIVSQSIPHAFLFAGPKGTGKTSAARILAKIINCQKLAAENDKKEKSYVPCDECEQCISITNGNNLDVIEMDAASHRGIDDIRLLRDGVKLAPTIAPKKIYIIDESHMLTTEASNALLKTLEEPPKHVLFILATTNPEKLLDTIRSRTTLISFRKANEEEISRSLKRVIDAEKIKITDKAIAKIAQMADGAFRDAIKILEQVSMEGESYLEKYESSELDSFIQSLIKKDTVSGINFIEKYSASGGSMTFFLKNILSILHKALLSEVGIMNQKLVGLSKDDLIRLIDLFSVASKDTVNSPIESLPVELAVVKWGDSKNTKEEEKPKKDNSAPDEEENVDDRNMKVETQASNINNQTSIPTSEFSHPISTEIHTQMVNDSIWNDILLAIRPINASIEGLLRSSKPVGYDGKTLTLGVFYKFHKERLEDMRHRKVLEEVIAKILNSPTKIKCTLMEPPPKKVIETAKVEPVLTEAKDADIIKIAEDIFSN